MGLFTKYCPECGGKLERTGYAFPYPQWRCPNCIRNNKMKKRMDRLEKKLEKQEEQ